MRMLEKQFDVQLFFFLWRLIGLIGYVTVLVVD